MLKKAVRKSLFKNKLLLLGITLLFVLSVFLFSLSIFAYDFLQVNYDAYVEETNQEDFRLFTSTDFEPVLTDEFITDMETTYDVNMEERKVITFPQVEDSDVRTQVTKYEAENTINTLTITEGEYPTNSGEVFILEDYALENDISVGDAVVIDNVTYTVSGYGFMPEYTLPFDMLLGSMPGMPFMAVYMNPTDYEKLNTDSEIIYYPVTTNTDLNKEEEKLLMESMMEENQVEIPMLDERGQPQISNGEIVTKEVKVFNIALNDDLNIALSGLQMEIDGGRSSMRIFCFVIIAFTIFLTIVLYNSIFKTQRREMGILKAEGISNGELKFEFTKVLVMILAVGAIIGMLIGYFIAPSFANIYMSIFTIPLTISAVSSITSVILQVLGLIVLITVVVYFFSIRRNIHIKPLLLIKNIDHSRKPRFKFGGKLLKIPFKIRYRLSILFRSAPYIVVLAIGVFIASFLLLMGALMMGSMKTMMDETYTEMFTYDYQVQYSPLYVAPEEDNSVLNLSADVIDVSSEGTVSEDSRVNINGMDFENNDYVHLKTESGDEIPLSDYEDGVVISYMVATQYGLEIGDTITFINPYDATKEITVEVNNIANDGFYAAIYVDLDYLQSLLGVDDTFVNGAYIAQEQKEAIEVSDPEAKFISVIDLQTSMNDTMQIFYVMIGLVMLIASVIAFISLSLITSIVVNNNRKTISVMKVMGYTNSEVRKMTTSSYKWIILVVYIISMPIIETLIQTVVNYAMSDMSFQVVIDLNFRYAIIGLVLIFIIYFLSMSIAQRSIKKIALAESLKVDE